ncbi:MAG: c-type cytochrome [Leptolyngbyaceae cyanobacterium bins.302]|nr:c-type cytochrome [Leptolyngbyaceae cyanobacterium bins.302]
MKKILSIGLAIIVLFGLVISRPAMAAVSPDVFANGAKVFGANCASCHMNGNNLINASKNLKAETLHQYGMDSVEAITTQVTNGKAAMPSFKGRLNAEQIEAVAAYVLEQSEKGWKG